MSTRIAAPAAWVTVDRQDDRVAHLSAHGELDLATADLLRTRLLRELASGTAVRLDMSAVTFADVVAVAMLADAQARFVAGGSSLLLTNPSRQVSRLLRLAQVDRKLLAAQPQRGG